MNHIPLNRRQYLQWTCGTGIAFLLPTLSARAATLRGQERPASLITLWMGGGPSQLETWDPHPGTSIGGPTQAIDTRVSGLKIAATLPLMAERMDRVSLLRSLVSKEGDHERGTYFVKTGYRPDPTVRHPAIGAVITHQLSTAHLDIPAFVSLGYGEWPGRGGYLGDQYDAFRVVEAGQDVRNLRPRVGEERQQRRLAGLDVVTRAFRQGRAAQADKSLHEDTITRAIHMMTSEQLKAFELEDEPVERRARYGETNFGRGCLVARRLVETGVRAVEVTLPGFDSHANNFETQSLRAAELDVAFSSLLDDLVERDLLESTIVLCIGEFGRTPRINPLDGRDHWPNGFSAVVAGGGLRTGQVLGETDPSGEKTDPVRPIPVQDLYATLLRQLNIDPSLELITPIGRPLALCEGTPIPDLLPDA